MVSADSVGGTALEAAIKTSLGKLGIYLLAFASAIVTANAYYIHPVIGLVADHFGVSHGEIGVVPALNQVALALGVLLLLPLGDRFSNRKFVAICLSVQTAALLVMALTANFTVFVASSSLLGFFTLTPYLLPAYASKRAPAAELGFVTAVLTAGVIAGVQLSRLASGILAEFYDWRLVYWLAAALMAVVTIALPAIMDDDVDETKDSYLQLMRSLVVLAKSHRDVLMSALIQGLNFGAFIAMWMGISLHVTGDVIGRGTDLVGYLTVVALLSLWTTPRLGRWADQMGAVKARLIMAVIHLFGQSLLIFAGESWVWLVPPLIISSIVGPMIDVTGRMTGLSQSAGVRTRLMSLYVTTMFIGGGLGSWSGTLVYDKYRWAGTVTLMVTTISAVCLLSAWQYWRSRK